MLDLEELRKNWQQQPGPPQGPASYDHASLEKIIRVRVNKHLKTSTQYFWASFVLQVLVYALLSHVMVKYWQDAGMLTFSLAGVLLFLPFTIVLLRKFKRMATVKPAGPENAPASLQDYVLQQQALLRSFYTFKKRYELLLIPLGTAIGVFLTFELFVPGGVGEHGAGAVITYVISLLACIAAIRAENQKSFETPIQQLQGLLEEFRTSP